MSSLEFLAKNVEKAVGKACDELKLTPDKIKYDILSHGSSGIFGLAGVKKAKIRVHLPREVDNHVPKLEIDMFSSAEIEKAEDCNHDSETISEDGDPNQQEVTNTESEEKLLDFGHTVLSRIVDSIAEAAEIFAERQPECLLYNISCQDPRVLIGKKGQTLDAIQVLVEKIVNKQNPTGNKIRVHVDVEGYLETKKANLEQLAGRMADKSKRNCKPVSLGQMSACERRIVHLALKNDPEIRTQSKGSGYIRRLVIFPQRSASKKQ